MKSTGDTSAGTGPIMSFFKRLFGITSASAPASSGPTSQLASGLSQQHSGMSPAAQNAARRELLQVVLRDTLNRHGIPGSWITPEVLVSTSRSGERGVHWRLLIKHWDPRLLTHSIAIQHALIKRVMTFDPMASGWLTGISWQLALSDETVCPPMPQAGFWTAEPSAAAPVATPAVLPGGSGDVIAGPVRIPETAARAKDPGDAARADLEQLFAVRDADFQRHAKNGDDKDAGATEPMWLGTEPAQLRP
jgi:hypothetical protein